MRVACQFRVLGLVLLLAAPAACAQPPGRDAIDISGSTLEALIAKTPPLPEPTLGRVTRTPEQRTFVRRVHALENALSEQPLLAGNQVKLLIDGPATHGAQLAAIARARHHVHMVVYILTDDEIGQRYLKAMRDRVRAGVKVRLMVDSVGFAGSEEPFREALRESGVELHEFAPMHKPEVWRITRRQHRKILVVDGRIAFTGGINVSDEYKEDPSGKGPESRTGWRDTHLQLEGPAVAELQRTFFHTWEDAVQGAIPKSAAYWPKLERRGDALVRIVKRNGQDLAGQALNPAQAILRGRSEPKVDSEHAIYGSYLAALSQSLTRIWITQAYFVPNREFLDVLKAAAARGVDVRVLVPGATDIKLILYASQRHYAELLEAGIRLFEYKGPTLHAKTAVVDGVWSTVGSSNLDYRSFIHNDEANAIVISHAFAKDMEDMFHNDLERAPELTREQWSDRRLWMRVREQFATLFKYWI